MICAAIHMARRRSVVMMFAGRDSGPEESQRFRVSTRLSCWLAVALCVIGCAAQDAQKAKPAAGGAQQKTAPAQPPRASGAAPSDVDPSKMAAPPTNGHP